MILSSYPTIDLHGYDKEYAIYMVKQFIEDNYKLKNRFVVIIHGIGKGTLFRAVHEYLKSDRRVKEYKLDTINTGCTIVTLHIDKI